MVDNIPLFWADNFEFLWLGMFKVCSHSWTIKEDYVANLKLAKVILCHGKKLKENTIVYNKNLTV